MVIVAYRPRAGQKAALLDLTRQHVPALRNLGLATDRPALAMRADDGTVIEVFEWKSAEAMAAAHAHPVVQQMWQQYAQACEYVKLATVKEFNDLFAAFEPIDL
jgi:hypothetical protein